MLKSKLTSLLKVTRQNSAEEHVAKINVAIAHSTKQKTIKEYASKFSVRVLIETGTYLGEMIEATKDSFDIIFSIELDQQLYEQAVEKFVDYEHILLVQGDSSSELPKVLDGINQPCLFWLDGHYSGGITAKGKMETPIVEEVRHILNHSITDHVILIDDARLFVGRDDYPTLEELKKIILEKRPSWRWEVKDDIIRVHSDVT